MRDPVDRRDALKWIGAAAGAAFGAACGGDSKNTSGAAPSLPTSTSLLTTPTTSARGTATPASCVLAREQTEGPYYLAGQPNRRDITEGRPGVPLRLDLEVVRAANCLAVAGATVEVWHADADGNYSGFGGGASGRTFLRGQQTAGADGRVTFDTVYPGAYQGRAVHIHVKVHNGGNTVHTGQLYFDDGVSRTVYTRAPYNARSGFVTNRQDGIYGDGGSQSTLVLSPSGDGYVGTLRLGIR